LLLFNRGFEEDERSGFNRGPLPSALSTSIVFFLSRVKSWLAALISEFMLAKSLFEDYNLTSKKTIGQYKGGFYG